MFNFNGSGITARQLSLARQMHDKLDLYTPPPIVQRKISPNLQPNSYPKPVLFNFFARVEPHGNIRFHWLKEPLYNNLVVLYKKQYLINNTIFSNLEIVEPLDMDKK